MQGRNEASQGLREGLELRVSKKEKLHRDARENHEHWPEAEKRDKGCRTKAQRCKIDLQREESLGEEDSQGETLARKIHLREE